MTDLTPETLREPRAGIHEDGTEELKSWDTLYAQCLAAATAMAAHLVDKEETEKRLIRCHEDADVFVKELQAHIEALEKENRILRANASKSVLRRLEDQGALAAEEKRLCDCVPGHLCELHAGGIAY